MASEHDRRRETGAASHNGRSEEGRRSSLGLDEHAHFHTLGASLTPIDMADLEVARGDRPPEGTDIRDVHARAERELRKRESHTSFFSGDLTGNPANTPLFPGILHLPDGAEIAFVYIENYAVTAKLTVTLGPGGNGSILGQVKPGTYSRMIVPDFISSISIMPTTVDTGLVICILSTDRHSPSRGAL